MSMKHLTGIVFVIFALALLAIGYAMPVHAQFGTGSPFLEIIPAFDLANDNLIQRISPNADFGFTMNVFREDVAEFFTFDPTAKAELKLKHAQEQQNKINDLDSRGLQIPLVFEERRIQKLNEAREIINNQEDSILTSTFNQLREMGELNDIRILYSQLPRVINADQQTKDDYNQKVNSLQTWQNNCIGEFDVDNMVPLSQAVMKIEAQCPKLIDLQDKFGYERIKKMVTGSI